MPHHTDLIGLGKGSLTENIVTSTDKLICKICGVSEVDTCNKARVKLYCIGRTQETLPPTADAAKFHIMRSHYQASVWNQAHSPYPDLPPVTEMGWMHQEGQLLLRGCFLCHLSRKLAVRSPHVVVRRVPQPTLQLQETCCRTVITLMTTRNKIM